MRQGSQITLLGTGDYDMNYTGKDEPEETQGSDSETLGPKFLSSEQEAPHLKSVSSLVWGAC